MKPGHRTLAGGQTSDAAFGFFKIDARIGHAWFARSDRAKRPPEPYRETLPALRHAELVLAGQGRAIARRARRVPADSIVPLGATLGCRSIKAVEPEPAAAAMASVANDNVPYLSSRTRTLLRELAFIAIFSATLAGTYFLGRMHAVHNVISVPDAGSRGHRVV